MEFDKKSQKKLAKLRPRVSTYPNAHAKAWSRIFGTRILEFMDDIGIIFEIFLRSRILLFPFQNSKIRLENPKIPELNLDMVSEFL